MTSIARRLAATAVLLGVCLAAVRAPAASRRVVAVGDIHGDLDAFIGILQRAGLTDRAGKWTAGNAVFVQTGDFLDRGPRVRAVMDLLKRLQRDAKKAGGQVHVLLGNHEAMNLLGLTRDVSPEALAEFADARSERRRVQQYDRYVELSAFRSAYFNQPVPLYQPPPKEQWLAAHPAGLVEYREALGPDGSYGRWLRSLPPAVKIDDTLFMHSGVNPARAPANLDEIAATVRKEVSRYDELRRNLIDGRWATPAFTMEETVFAAKLAHLVQPDNAQWNPDAVPTPQWTLVDPEGPLWFTGLASRDSSALEAPLIQMLERYSARRLVVGHTVTHSRRIGRRFDGRLIFIDTGMLSRVYPGGHASALEIVDGRLRAIYDDRVERLGDQRPRAPIRIVHATCPASGSCTSANRVCVRVSSR